MFLSFLESYRILTWFLFRGLQQSYRSCFNYFLAIAEFCEYLHYLFHFDCRYQLCLSPLGNLIPLLILAFAFPVARILGVQDCFHWKEKLATGISWMQSSLLMVSSQRPEAMNQESEFLCTMPCFFSSISAPSWCFYVIGALPVVFCLPLFPSVTCTGIQVNRTMSSVCNMCSVPSKTPKTT